MEVDEPLVCFRCINPKSSECLCPCDDVKWILKCSSCLAPIRIYQKVMSTINFQELHIFKDCFPTKILCSYDIEENLYRFEFRRVHYNNN